MKNIYRHFIFTLLLSLSTFAQTKIIDVKIDSIASDDSNPKKRKFKIDYHIENLTNHDISFFLRPNTLIANAASSLTLFPIYKIYQNNHFIAMDGPFYEREGSEDVFKYNEMNDKSTPEAKTLLQKILTDFDVQKKKIVDDYKKNGGTMKDEGWIIKNHNQMRSKITLKPKEKKSFTIKTHWNKERYILQDDLEYYLDEKDKFELELTLQLIKTHFEGRLSAEEYSKIANDKNFIEGIFTSNKVNLNFK